MKKPIHDGELYVWELKDGRLCASTQGARGDIGLGESILDAEEAEALRDALTRWLDERAQTHAREEEAVRRSWEGKAR